MSLLEPYINPIAKCSVRVWEYRDTGQRSLHVFMHPNEWRFISMTRGTPVIVTCQGVLFETVIYDPPEWYKWGRISKERAAEIDWPPADYDAEARIDWDNAVPELVKDALLSDKDLLEVWRSQAPDVIRIQISRVRRVEKETSRVERQLQLIEQLRSS